MGPTLLIEDNDDIRELVVELLQRNGYPSVAAADGAGAFRALHDGLRPSLIFLDLGLPDMPGLTFLDLLVAAPELATIPVVVMSGTHVVPQYPVVGMLLKPVRGSVILETVHRLVGEPSAGATTLGTARFPRAASEGT